MVIYSLCGVELMESEQKTETMCFCFATRETVSHRSRSQHMMKKFNKPSFKERSVNSLAVKARKSEMLEVLIYRCETS